MNILSSVLLSLLLTATPPAIPPLTIETANDWEPTGSSLVIIKRVAEDGQTYEVAYPGKIIPCGPDGAVPSKKRYPFIILKSAPEGAPAACYLVPTEPVGYFQGGQLMSLIEKTWPIK